METQWCENFGQHTSLMDDGNPFASNNCTSDLLQQLDHCTRSLNHEVSTHGKFLEELLSNEANSPFVTDVRSSLNGIQRRIDDFNSASRGIMKEIDDLRNKKLSQTREFLSLQATFREAESQLEEARESEHKLRSLTKAYESVRGQLKHQEHWVVSSHAPSWAQSDLHFPTAQVGVQTDSGESISRLPKKILHDSSFTEVSFVNHLSEELKATHEKLLLHHEQTNELEALLAERESQLATQAHELQDAEAQLANTTQLITQLQQHIASKHEGLNQQLQQLPFKSGNPLPDDLPVMPAVLELVSNLDTAYAELENSERWRLKAEKQATDAMEAVRELQQLKTYAGKPATFCDQFVQTASESSSPCSYASGNKASFPEDYHSNNMVKNDSNQIAPFTFARPNDVLSRLSTTAIDPSDPAQLTELRESLHNAVVQIERLNRYRLAQKQKSELLHQRISQMNHELDATVDALRYHQSSAEEERHRAAAELSNVRVQLAKANTLLEHHKRFIMTKSGDESHRMALSARAASVSPEVLRPHTPLDESSSFHLQSTDPLLQLRLCKNELDQLRRDMTRQKADSDREVTQLRGQLAEANADARTMRQQTTRLQTTLSNKFASHMDPQAGQMEPLSCTNCQRLQRLLEIIQTKQDQVDSPMKCMEKMSSKSIKQDAQSQCDLIDVDSTDMKEASTLEMELLVAEKQRLTREKHDLAAWRTALTNEQASLQEATIRLQNESNHLQNTTSHLAQQDADVKQRCREAEQLVYLATEERQAVELLRQQLTQSHDKPSDLDVPNNRTYDMAPSICDQEVQTSVYDRMIFGCESTTSPLSLELLGESTSNWRTAPDLLLSKTESLSSHGNHTDLHELLEDVLSLREQLNNERLELEQEKAQLCIAQTATLVDGPTSPATENSDVTIPTENGIPMLRLRAAEHEAEEAIAQLKASNAEFLTLRERVSHAAVERAYLKSAVEELDEQVAQLETSLYERTQQLHLCRSELAKCAKPALFRIAIPEAVCHIYRIIPISLDTMQTLVRKLDCRRRRFQLPTTQNPMKSPTRHLSLLARCSNIARPKLDGIKRFLCNRATVWRIRPLLLAQPRRSVFIGFLFYLVFLHVCLFRIYVL